jgi:dynein heavy chain
MGTCVCVQVANQLVKRSKEHLLVAGKLWEQDRPALIAALGTVVDLHAAFAQQCSPLLSSTASSTGNSSSGQPAPPRSPPKPPAKGGGAAAALAAAQQAAAAEELSKLAFAKYGLFAQRCGKLAEMFGTVHSFSQLAAHTHIEGVSAVLAKFWEVSGHGGWPCRLDAAALCVAESCALGRI